MHLSTWLPLFMHLEFLQILFIPQETTTHIAQMERPQTVLHEICINQPYVFYILDINKNFNGACGQQTIYNNQMRLL